MDKTFKKTLKTFQVVAANIGTDEEARISACRRAFGYIGGGWMFIRSLDTNTIVVAGNFFSGDLTRNRARGVKVSFIGEEEITFAPIGAGEIRIGNKITPTTRYEPVA